jgi:translocation and assembly module TamA
MRRCSLLIFAIILAGFGMVEPAGATSRAIVRIDGALPSALRVQIEAGLPRSDTLPPTLFDARRAAGRALDTVLETLMAEGYYAARADIDAEPEGGAARGIVRVRAGPLFRFAGASPEAPETVFATPLDPATAARVSAAAHLTPDAPATGLAVVTAEAAGLAELRAAGYADAVVLPRVAEADHATQRLTVRFAFDPGAPVRLGPVLLSTPTSTDRRVVERMAGWRTGDPYTPEALETLSRRLTDTGVFDAASVQLAPSGQTAGTGEAAPRESEAAPVRPVIVALTDRRARTINLGASVSTTEGIGVEAEWRRRNLLRRADTLVVSARLASLERTFAAEISAPQGSGAGRLLTLGAEVTNRETDAFDQTGGAARISLQADRTGTRFSGVGAAVDASRIRDLNGERTFYVASFFAEKRLDRSDSLLDPSRGWRAEARLEPSLAGGDEQAAFVRAQAAASAYLPLKAQGRLTLAARGRAASVIGAPLAAVPADRRVYAGGGGSVRGYEYQSLSPGDRDTGRVTGGASLAEASAELRGRVGRAWGYAAFVDAGGAARGAAPRLGDLSVGVGLGLRYYAGFGPIRADIAAPLERRSGQAGVQFYLSLGQAF